jgi:hypothetical protein
LFSVPLVEIKAIFLHYQNFVFYWLFYIWIHIKYSLWREPFLIQENAFVIHDTSCMNTLGAYIFPPTAWKEKKISCWECNIFIKKIK